MNLVAIATKRQANDTTTARNGAIRHRLAHGHNLPAESTGFVPPWSFEKAGIRAGTRPAATAQFVSSMARTLTVRAFVTGATSKRTAVELGGARY